MQTLTEEVIKLAPPDGLFDSTVVRNLFPGRTEGARKVLISRALEAEEILTLKRGLYILRPEYRKSDPHPYTVAAMLHAPSHVSLESALAYHGLIPEAVHQVSSVTSARSRSFETPLGVFTFQRVPARKPRAGVEAVKVSPNAWAFIGTAVRAIADTVYLRKDITWKRDGLSFLSESLRIEEEDLAQLDFSCSVEIEESLHDRRTCEYLSGLKMELNR